MRRSQTEGEPRLKRQAATCSRMSPVLEAPPKNPHVVYLVTNGESIGDSDKVFMKPEEDILSKTGELQVDLLGKYMSREKMTRLFCSDYPKALQTANVIIRHTKEKTDIRPEVKRDPRLRERGVLTLEGKTFTQALEGLVRSGGDVMAYDPEGCEKMKAVGNRIHYFFKEICDELDKSESDQEVCVIVSHPLVLTTLVNIIAKSGMYKVSDWNPSQEYELMRNASFIKMSVSVLIDNSQDFGKLPAKREIQFVNVPTLEHFQSLVEKNYLCVPSTSKAAAEVPIGCILV